MNKSIKHLINKMRNQLSALSHSLSHRRDRAQARLLADLRETSAELEIEVLSAIEEMKREREPT
jgi:hypothetical protein